MLLDLAKNTQPAALSGAIQTAARTAQSIGIDRVRLNGVSSGEFTVQLTPLGLERLHFLVVFEPGARHEEPTCRLECREPGKTDCRPTFGLEGSKRN